MGVSRGGGGKGGWKKGRDKYELFFIIFDSFIKSFIYCLIFDSVSL